MARFGQQIILPGAEFPLETAVALLDYYSKADYYVYERDDIWYLGLGAHASLVVDPKGQTATEIDSEGRKESSTILNLLTGQVRQFVSKYSIHGKIFGRSGSTTRRAAPGQAYAPSQWPMLSLMVPRVQVIIDRVQIAVTGHAENDAYEASRANQRHPQIDLPGQYLSPIRPRRRD